MTQNQQASGRWISRVLMIGAVLIVVPVIMMGIGVTSYLVSRANAQDAAQQRDRIIREKERSEQRAKAIRSTRVSGVRTEHQDQPAYRPITETQFREQRVQVYEPVVDKKTGETKFETREIVQRVPVVTTRMVRTTSKTSHDPRVAKLAGELREMSDDDDGRDGKLKELRQRLELEFSAMHENQAKEIKQTAARLESLKRLHDERGENKDKIIQRRIDELLGKEDALRWNATTAVETQAPTRAVYAQPTRVFPSTPEPTRAITPVPAKPPVPQVGLYPNSVQLPSPPKPPGISDTRARSFQRVEIKTNPSSSQSRRSDAASTLGEVFQLARNSANTIAELAENESRQDQLAKLKEKGLLPVSEFRKAELQIERLKREVELNKLQLEALAASFERELKVAETALSHAKSRLKSVESAFVKGIETNQTRDQAKFDTEKAIAGYEAAKANLEQLMKAMQLVKDPRRDDDDRRDDDARDRDFDDDDRDGDAVKRVQRNVRRYRDTDDNTTRDRGDEPYRDTDDDLDDERDERRGDDVDDDREVDRRVSLFRDERSETRRDDDRGDEHRDRADEDRHTDDNHEDDDRKDDDHKDRDSKASKNPFAG